jgi:TolB-like protein
MRRLVLRLIFTCLVSAAIHPQSSPVPAEPRLIRVAVLPFENLTPNPNIDWVSSLFVESYKTALAKRYRFQNVSDTDAAKALEVIAEYRLSGKVRYQVFAALTGAEVIMGGSFAPSGSEAIVIESQLYAARTDRLEVLDKQATPIDSSKLFPAVDRAAAAAVALLRAGGQVGEEKPVLAMPYLPRLAFYLPEASKSPREEKALRSAAEANLAPNGTHELMILRHGVLPGETGERQKYLEREGIAYAAASEWVGSQFVLRLYSPLRAEPLAAFSAPGISATREKSAGDAMKQLAAFLRGQKFRPQLEVTGLKGKDLQVELSGVKKLETSANGILRFDQQLPLGTDYVITLGIEPHSPAQRCFVLNATGRVTITGTNHVVVVCITQRYAIEGTVEGLSGGEVVLQVNDTERLTLRESAPFRIPETFEDYESLRLVIHSLPQTPPQQCDFISPPERVTGKKTKLRLYCMPLTQHWLTFSVNYPMLQGNSARSDYLVPNASFPLNALSGRFGLTAGYWARYFLRYNVLVGGEATYAFFQGMTDLYTTSGVLVEPGQTLCYHGVGLNAMAGYPFRLPGSSLEMTRLVVFAGFGPRYVSLRSGAPISLLNAMGFGVLAGFSWHYQWTEQLQVGLRYHADAFQVTSEPFIIQHQIGAQVGVQLW